MAITDPWAPLNIQPQRFTAYILQCLTTGSVASQAIFRGASLCIRLVPWPFYKTRPRQDRDGALLLAVVTDHAL